MATLKPVSPLALIARLGRLGFEGPYSGGKHPFMVRGRTRVTVPNPHHGEIGTDLLARVLRRAGVSREEWESVA